MRRKTFKVCEVEGCAITSDNGKVYGKLGKFKMNLCDNHWAQMNNHGRILDRTRFNANEFIVNGDIAKIILYDKHGNISGETLVNSKHIDLLKQYKWHLTDGAYVKTTVPGVGDIKLHRLITHAPIDMVVDHRNHNPLDNLDSNLRVCTQQENMRNVSLKSNNTSGVTGVSWDKRRNKWVVRIRVDSKYKWIGEFREKQDAIDARKNAEVKYFGDFRYKASLCPSVFQCGTKEVSA